MPETIRIPGVRPESSTLHPTLRACVPKTGLVVVTLERRFAPDSEPGNGSSGYVPKA